MMSNRRGKIYKDKTRRRDSISNVEPQQQMAFPLRGVLLVLALVIFLPRAEGQCDSDWKEFNKHCYYVSDTHEYWSDALRLCRIRGGSLANILDHRDNEFIRKEIYSSTTYAAWIGGHDSGPNTQWLWADKTRPIGRGDYRNWVNGSPRNAYNVKMCMMMQRSNGKWVDGECIRKSKYVCQKRVNTNPRPGPGEDKDNVIKTTTQQSLQPDEEDKNEPGAGEDEDNVIKTSTEQSLQHEEEENDSGPGPGVNEDNVINTTTQQSLQPEEENDSEPGPGEDEDNVIKTPTEQSLQPDEEENDSEPGPGEDEDK